MLYYILSITTGSLHLLASEPTRKLQWIMIFEPRFGHGKRSCLIVAVATEHGLCHLWIGKSIRVFHRLVANVLAAHIFDFVNIGLENERKALVKFVKMLVPRDKHAAAVEIEKEYVSPFGTMIAGALIFIVTAIAASVVFSVIVKVMGFLSRIKVVSAANSFGGLALGIVKGLAYAVLAAYVVSLIVESSKNQLGKINTDIIDNTYLFKYFFRLFYR